eukprot:4352382-Prymnesium_polylepis.1
MRGITSSIHAYDESSRSPTLILPKRSMRARVDGPKFGCLAALPVNSTCNAPVKLLALYRAYADCAPTTQR